MAMSEELQRRISNLTGDEASLYDPEPQQSYMMASGQSDPYAGLELPDTEYLRNRQASGPAVFQNQDIKELLADYAGRIADGEPKLVQDAQSYYTYTRTKNWFEQRRSAISKHVTDGCKQRNTNRHFNT